MHTRVTAYLRELVLSMPARARDLCTLILLRSRRTVAHLDTWLTCMSPPSRTQIFSCWPGYSTPHYAHQHVQHARTPTYRAHPIPNCSKRAPAARARPDVGTITLQRGA